MTKLQDLNILEKASQLEALIAKADLDVDYSIQVKWDGNKDVVVRDARVLIANTRLLFQTGGIDQLEDMSVKEEAFANYHTMLDSYLKKFPEYELDDVITESVTQRHI